MGSGLAGHFAQCLQVVLRVAVVGQPGLGLEVEGDLEVVVLELERLGEPGQSAQRAARQPRLFDEIFLMAADEDHDAFELEHKLQPLPELGRNVHVYFNRGDTALVISDKTKANPTRLGSYGPRSPLTVPGNVELVDCSEVVGGVVEHSYFLDDPSTVRDVRAVLGGEAQDMIKGRRYLSSQNKYVLGR